MVQISICNVFGFEDQCDKKAKTDASKELDALRAKVYVVIFLQWCLFWLAVITRFIHHVPKKGAFIFSYLYGKI